MAQRLPKMLKLNNSSDLSNSLKLSRSFKFNGIITKLSSDLYKREYIDETVGEHHQQFSRCPLSFNSSTYLNEVTPSLEITSLLDCTNKEERENYEERLKTDIQFAFHVKATGPVYIKPYCKPKTLGEFLKKNLPRSVYNPGFIIEIELVHKDYYRRMVYEDENEDDDLPDTWNYWNEVHKAADYDWRLGIALVLSADVPFEDDNMISRWLGEAVDFLVVPHNCYVYTSQNFPVLSAHNRFLVKMFLHFMQCTIVFETKNLTEEQICHYKDYMTFLEKFINFNGHELYNDNAPSYPLQPLRDDLDFSVYEVFETDKAKYSLYQKAIEAALVDLVPFDEKETKKLIVLIVGAGRGPLVRSALNAAENTDRKIKIIIVEKNRSAINTIRALVNDLWVGKDIEIIAKDMRKIELAEKADIMVSELLGSFGDNELSPECLDGVQHLLKDTGVSIPCDSVSYLRPIMSKKLNTNIERVVKRPIVTEDPSIDTRFESAWLWYMQNAFFIDNPKETFKFVHPNKAVPIDNSRFKQLKFSSSVDCILHGFAGYFSSKLYKNIEISIHPETHTKGMTSWYPIFFSLPKIMQLKKNDKIELNIWRKVDSEKVWYEYQVTAPETSKIVNSDGKCHSILL